MIFKKLLQKFNKSKQQDIGLLPFDLNALNESPRPVLKEKVMPIYGSYIDENGISHLCKVGWYSIDLSLPDFKGIPVIDPNSKYKSISPEFLKTIPTNFIHISNTTKN